MTRLYVVHVDSPGYGIGQRYVNAEDARRAVRMCINDPKLVVAVVVQGTGERVASELWQ